ncbi:hypothetical protein ESCO_003662 [Escovopsis weberi]|uniref:Uncharacterized protein n=1 Tax=Escovopsis weberi TaxID=150374 RepID=A0A0M8NAB0_ESCWE|nr:hypothetical protein ESCO_003662 [Escovopsis weberi]
MDTLEPRPMTASPSPAVQFDDRVTQYDASRAAASATTTAMAPRRLSPRASPSHSMCMPMRPAPESRFSESRVYTTTTETTSHTERTVDDQAAAKGQERVQFRTTYSDGRHSDRRHEEHEEHQRRSYSDSRYAIAGAGPPGDNNNNNNNNNNHSHGGGGGGGGRDNNGDRDKRDGRETWETWETTETTRETRETKEGSLHDHYCRDRVPPVSSSDLDIRSARTSSRNQLEEVLRLTMQRSRHRSGREDIDWQIRSATGIYLTQLRILQSEVRKIAKAAQHHRWRRWLIGGFMATIIPAMRAIFRRRADPDSGPCCTNNNTEMAFQQSQSWFARVREGAQKHGQWASMAAFVFSLLFVFSNEVLFRVAKTVYKRVRKTAGRIEREGEVREGDLEVLEGWRWRVMLWG